MNPPVWHALAVGEAARALDVDPASGLTVEEARSRLAKHGANELATTGGSSAFDLLLDQFKNVLILILLAAVVLSAFLGHTVEAVTIAVIVLFAVFLGFIQEYRAERAIEALRSLASPTARVLRGGVEETVPAREVVPGDVLLLQAGDRVAADGRVLDGFSLKADEAMLTGESEPTGKRPDALSDPGLGIGDRKNLVHAGTAIAHGRGRALVFATGMATEFGKVARLLETVEVGRTPLQQNLDRVGHALARAAFVVIAAIVALGIVRGQPLVEMLIFGIALAVAVVPEALPAVVSISLAIGLQRMVKRHALVRRLPAVETLGSTSYICSDKTGTLTKDQMTVRRLWVEGREIEVEGAGYEPRGRFLDGGAPVAPSAGVLDLLTAAALASDATVLAGPDGSWAVRGDPTEGALVVAAMKAGLDKHELERRAPRVDEVPFTSETKRMTTLHEENGRLVAFAKGAPETIVQACTRVRFADGETALDAATRSRVLDAARAMAGGALRVLAVARREGVPLTEAEADLTLLGLLGMSDPPRPEAKAAIATCTEAGIRPVMITGDHPLTARAVAAELGLLNRGVVVSGAELESWSDDELRSRVEEVEAFARVSPAHKLRVVTALQARGHVVAMTGDGVNDAPALKKADVGVAMGRSGTDVSREAAEMTLTDDNFASIVAAVEEGRGIFGNIKKYLMYLLSSNLGEIGLMAGAAALGLPLPLSAVQILYVNLATDGLPALALAVDPPEADLMRRPPRNPRTGIFTRPVVALMLAGGLWSAAVNLAVFAGALAAGRSAAEAMTLTFLSLVLIQFFKAYSFRSDRHSIFVRPFANRWLNRAILWELGLLGLVLFWGPLERAFQTVPLGPWELAGVTLAAATVVPVLEAMKWVARKGWLGALD